MITSAAEPQHNPLDHIMTNEFVTVTVDGQLFGLPVLSVRDVLKPQPVAPIPLAPPEVAGSLNLRGHIVTVVDIRKRLGLPPRTDTTAGIHVVVEHNDELFSLVADGVGEVLSFPPDTYEPTPTTLTEVWRQIATGIHRLDDGLMIAVDIEKLLDIRPTVFA